jgi:hypothetical protein
MAKKLIELLIDFYQQQLQNLDELLENKKITPEEHEKFISDIANKILDLYEQIKKESE